MIDLVSFNKSLKLTWIKKYLDSLNKGKWKIFLDLKLGKNAGELVFAGNLSVKDTKIKFKNSDSFTKELLEIWAEVNFECEINSKEQLFQQPLWFNSLISIGNQPIFLKKLGSTRHNKSETFVESELWRLSFPLGTSDKV